MPGLQRLAFGPLVCVYALLATSAGCQAIPFCEFKDHADRELCLAQAESTGEDSSTASGGGGGGGGDGENGAGDFGCLIGSAGCPCTAGGACDSGLTCDAGICVSSARGESDGDGESGGDGDDGDGDGDAEGDGDGDPGPNELPYGPCPAGDVQCLDDEICIKGSAEGVAWSLCTLGACTFTTACNRDAVDTCAKPTGVNGSPDGKYCVPQPCFNSPCPPGMQCFMGATFSDHVCLWPE
jgi:hypothetical protein